MDGRSGTGTAGSARRGSRASSARSLAPEPCTRAWTSRTTTTSSATRAASLGEAVFVPRAADAAEDDGWVPTLVHDATTDTSALHILNGEDFLGAAQAVIGLPQRVPAGFHGNWVPDQA